MSDCFYLCNLCNLWLKIAALRAQALIPMYKIELQLLLSFVVFATDFTDGHR